MVNNLKVLSILHYVYGALVCVMGMAMLSLVGLGAFLASDVVAQNAEEPPPEWLGAFLGAFGMALFIIILLWGLFIVLSGRWIARRRNRTASIVVAALCLLSFPFGTALGIFTLVVLLNDEVRQAYDNGAMMH